MLEIQMEIQDALYTIAKDKYRNGGAFKTENEKLDLEIRES